MPHTATRSHLMRSLAAPVAAIVVSVAGFAPAAARAQDPIPNPTANRTASQTTLQACYSDAAGQRGCWIASHARVQRQEVKAGVRPGFWRVWAGWGGWRVVRALG